MLNDIARFREARERDEKRPISESVTASRWRDEVFECVRQVGAADAPARARAVLEEPDL